MSLPTSVCPDDKQVPMKCHWCYWSAACSWVILITPCPVQHLQQSKTLQGAKLRISPRHTVLSSTYLPVQGGRLGQLWLCWRLSCQKLEYLKFHFSGACRVICVSQHIDSCSTRPQWALMNFLLLPLVSIITYICLPEITTQPHPQQMAGGNMYM